MCVYEREEEREREREKEGEKGRKLLVELTRKVNHISLAIPVLLVLSSLCLAKFNP